MRHQTIIIYLFLLTENLSQRPVSFPLECSGFLFILRSTSMEMHSAFMEHKAEFHLVSIQNVGCFCLVGLVF